MLNLLLFARYREEIGTEQLSLQWQPHWQTVADVIASLVERGEAWTVLNDAGLMCAINQQLCKVHTTIKAGDELALFPTVTGG
ncbi:MoaD/ThiS family protein [Pseudomonas sp. F1_0610]|uniref:MoaD/ThiS family protein n=1 Tax=Pseudomonas sp. F1_0610 TaxID=3114284 RepID=UPI0039C25C53